MTPHHIETIAREMFLFGVHDPKRPLRSMDRERIAAQWDTDETIRDYWITRATLVWSLAIEEAAKVADGENYHGAWRTWSFYKPDAMGNRMNDDINGGNLSRHSDNIAAAIRALAVEG